MRHTLLLVLFASFCGLACAQQKPVKAPAPGAPAAAPGITDETIYPLPLEQRDKIRDLQHENDQLEIENDQLEIENQKMLTKIEQNKERVEQNKARQTALVDKEKIIATEYARSRNLDPSQMDMDPAAIALRKRKGK